MKFGTSQERICGFGAFAGAERASEGPSGSVFEVGERR